MQESCHVPPRTHGRTTAGYNHSGAHTGEKGLKKWFLDLLAELLPLTQPVQATDCLIIHLSMCNTKHFSYISLPLGELE